MQQTYLARLAARTSELLAGPKLQQCGALCWRIGEAGSIEVLLVTSRDTGRWVIPKGNIKKKERQFECAQREALEEAGVSGKVGKKAIGQFVYLKDHELPAIVSVFPLMVERENDDFPERKKRQRIWVVASEAEGYVQEPELKGLFRLIISADGPKSFRRAVNNARRYRPLMV